MAQKVALVQYDGPEFEAVIFNIVDRAIKLNQQNIAPTQQPTAEEKYRVGAKAAADFMGVRPQTVYQNIGRIPHSRQFGRLYFKESDLTAFVEGGRQAA